MATIVSPYLRRPLRSLSEVERADEPAVRATSPRDVAHAEGPPALDEKRLADGTAEEALAPTMPRSAIAGRDD